MLSDTEKARSKVKDDILSKYVKQIDNCSTVPHMVPPTVKVIKDLTAHILTEHYLYLSPDYDPLCDILQAAKMLQDAIDTKNQKSIKEVEEIEADR